MQVFNYFYFSSVVGHPSVYPVHETDIKGLMIINNRIRISLNEVIFLEFNFSPVISLSFRLFDGT